MKHLKKFYLLFYGIFLLGFLLKFFHIHYNAILMIVGLAGIFAGGIISLSIKKTRSMLHLCIGGWLLVLLVSVKFFAFGTLFLIFAILLSLAGIIIAIKKDQWKRFLPLGIVIVIALVFYLMPTDQRYYLLNLRWSLEKNTDYISWDKYAWFLYQNGHVDSSAMASDKALEIALSSGNEKWIDFIEMHNESIKKRSWDTYR